jgi:protein involved in polysaccharide export with SLBB domain
MKVSRLTFVAVLGGVLLSGCSTLRKWNEARTQPPPPSFAPATVFEPATVADRVTVDPSLLQRPTTDFRLGPGDQLEIEVLGDIATRARTTVGPDGKIYFYILPGIDVWGATLAEARERIVKELQKYVREEQPVSVTLRDVQSQRVWLLGRLARPGVYAMAGPTTLLEAIAEAGGPAPATAGAMTLTPTAAMGATGPAGPSPRGSSALTGASAVPAMMMIGTNTRGASDEAGDLGRAFIVRQGKMLHVDFQRLLREGDMTQNIYLQPDDMVYLPSGSTGNIHVLGAVGMPKAIDYTGRVTLAQAVAQAGGAIRGAYLTNVAIVRGSLTQPKVATVDFEAIQNGTAPDVVLEAADIVYVPDSPQRVLTRYVDLILNTFAARSAPTRVPGPPAAMSSPV